ncbi:hypothetical protein [Nocardioides sambongensis]|uniref:hypothetical protein n=1 Tax=Nocardioides sambongensis TaxID=2589074 RepID=UPI00112C0C96|nr:hypothetical protein [Nocardioides sambongensis]
MTTTIRRLTAAVAVPATLMLALTACGGDETESGADDTSSQADESADSEATETEESPEAEESDPAGEVPQAGDIPNPVDDPDGFQAYIEEMYVDAGMSASQAKCMAGAFMDHVDTTDLNDADAITGMMTDPELQDAMTDCV